MGIYIEQPVMLHALNDMQLELINEQINKIEFNPSNVVGDVTSDARTSVSSSLPYNTPATKHLKTLTAKTFAVNERQCEPSIHIAKYSKDQQYRPHHDSCCDASDECKNFKKVWGDRIATLLVYLNDDFSGGVTEFPHLGISFQPKKGMAVAWRSASCPHWALHAGKPVTEGSKTILTIWVREKKTH